GNIPDFRKAVLEALKNEKTKEKLLLEIKQEEQGN
ncbi:type VI secretion system contractile sheath small subunit, partial [Campylobacter sp. BCW_8712]